MIINFSPVRLDEQIRVSVQGDAVKINDDVLDFSPLPDGATLPDGAVDNKWIIGEVSRANGQICLTIMLPNARDASEAARFPQSVTITQDGEVNLPV